MYIRGASINGCENKPVRINGNIQTIYALLSLAEFNGKTATAIKSAKRTMPGNPISPDADMKLTPMLGSCELKYPTPNGLSYSNESPLRVASILSIIDACDLPILSISPNIGMYRKIISMEPKTISIVNTFFKIICHVSDESMLNKMLTNAVNPKITIPAVE